MKLNFSRRRITSNNWLFHNHYIDTKGLFLHRFGELPNISYIRSIDMAKAYTHIREWTSGDVQDMYQHAEYNHDEKQALFNVTILVLADNRMLEIGTDYVAVLYGRDDHVWVSNLLQRIAAFRVTETHQPGRIGFTRQSMN